MREQLERQGADARVTADIEKAVLQPRRPVARGGRAVVASASGVVCDEPLLRPVSTPVVRVSELPYLVPLVELGFEQSKYLLAIVDNAGADITAHATGTRRWEIIDDFEAFDAVFIVGEGRCRPDLLAALPDRVGERGIPLQVGTVDLGPGVEEITGPSMPLSCDGSYA